MERKIPATFSAIKNRPPRNVFLAGFLVLFFLAACGKEPVPATSVRVMAVDPAALALPPIDLSTPIPPDAPRRIVSLIPSVTEILFALGLGDRIVARSSWCDYPPAALALPALGRQQDLSAEKIADFRPDLVVSWTHLPDLSRSLREVFHLNVVTPETESREQVLAGIVAVAAATKVPERGAALAAAIRRGLDDVRTRYSGVPKRRVLVVLDRNPLYAPGRASFLDEMLGTVGAENAAASAEGPAWLQFSAEKILDWNPDVIIDLSLGDTGDTAEAASYWARFPEAQAVRNGRVLTAAAGVIVRPGPRMAGVAAMLGRWIHEP